MGSEEGDGDGGGAQGARAKLYLTQSAFQVVLQKSAPPQIVALSFSIKIKNKLTDLCRDRLLLKDFKNTLCEIKPGPETGSEAREGDGGGAQGARANLHRSQSAFQVVL